MLRISRRTRWATVGLAILSATAVDARTWTNDQGRTIEAEFVRARRGEVLLRQDDEIIRAPINRLSEADQQWVERYRELARPREWGAGESAVRGRFAKFADDDVEVRQGSATVAVSFDTLSGADRDYLDALHGHLDRELPEAYRTARPVDRPGVGAAPPSDDTPVRQWTDVRGRKLEAKFGGTLGDKAILWKGDKRFDFPIERLSDADRAWLAERGVGQLAEDLQNSWAAANEFVAMVAARSLAGPAAGPPPGGRPPVGSGSKAGSGRK